MCQIQIIQKLNKDTLLDKSDIGEFFKMMCFGSMWNKDAFGVFNKDYEFKQSGGFSPCDLNLYMLEGEEFVVGHNRLASVPSLRGFSRSINEYQVETKATKLDKENRLNKAIELNKVTKVKPKGFCSKLYSWFFDLNHSPYYLRNFKDIGSIYFDKKTSRRILPPNGLEEIKVSKKKQKYKGDLEGSEVEEEVEVDLDILNEDNHPFNIGKFCLVHNGHITNYKDLKIKYGFKTNIQTDSYVILALIDYFFKKSRKRLRIEKVVQAITKTIPQLKGSFSVVLYDKKLKKIFYFKEKSTKFYFYKYDNNTLGASTEKDILENLYQGIGRKEIKIKPNKVYILTGRFIDPLEVVDLERGYNGNHNSNCSGNNRSKRRLRNMRDKNVIEMGDTREQMKEKLDKLFTKKLGYIPFYKITWFGRLKISRNNALGIRENIWKITKNYYDGLLWFTIKNEDLYELKGG